MNFIEFTEAEERAKSARLKAEKIRKKAPKKLLRSSRLDNVATKQVAKSMVMGAGRKGLLWQEQGLSVEDITKKMESYGVKLKNKKRELAKRINDNYKKNYLKPNSSKKVPLPSAESTIDKIKEIQSDAKKKSYPVNQPPLKMDIELNEKQRNIVEDKARKSFETVKSPNNTNQVLKPKGSNIGLKAAGVVGLTALTVGGGVALYRKMRSDKGKKRGKYKNFNFPGQLINF